METIRVHYEVNEPEDLRIEKRLRRKVRPNQWARYRREAIKEKMERELKSKRVK